MKKLFTLLVIFALSLGLFACGEDISYLPLDDFTQFEEEIQAEVDRRISEALDGYFTQAQIEAMLEDYLAVNDYTPYSPALAAELTTAANNLTLPSATLVSDITLPTVPGILVVWQSSHPQYVNTNGDVTQPSFTTGDVAVELTAFLIKNGQVTSKSFSVNVPAQPETDAEKMEKAIEAIGTLLSSDTYSQSVDLPKTIYGANIQWVSTNQNYFSATGKVLRPHFDQTDAAVTLTAYISAGTRFQLYQKALTVPKMEFKQYGLLASGPFNAANVNATTGAPLTFKLVTQEGHELYIPYSNVNAEFINNNSPYPYVYTPAFSGTQVPLVHNVNGSVIASGFGVAHVIVNNVVETIYDGISNRIYNAEHPGGFIANATNYLSNIPIPANGYVVVFHNSAATIGNTLNGREFGRNIIGVNVAALGKTLNMVGLGLDDIGVQLDGGVFWRGFVEVTVPFKYINPAPYRMFTNWANRATEALVSNFAFFQGLSMTSDSAAPLADGTNVTGAYPLLFNGAYFDTYSTGAYAVSVVNTGQGFTLAAVMSPEAEKTQIIQIQEQDKEIILTNQFEITRVYDGIGGSIKTKGAAQTPLAGGDSGKAMGFGRDSFLAFWANNGVDYAADTHNRRIAADYFYAIENWVWGFTAIEQEDMLAAGYRKYLFVDIFDQFEFVE
jgi:hypothetical protein